MLSVASNLIKEYGPDNIAVEVVAFGPGITLLTDTSEFRALVDSLVTQGIRFDVCGNTLDTIERETGSRPKHQSDTPSRFRSASDSCCR